MVRSDVDASISARMEALIAVERMEVDVVVPAGEVVFGPEEEVVLKGCVRSWMLSWIQVRG